MRARPTAIRHLALALVLLSPLAEPAAEAEAPERIVVVSDDKYPPYIFRDPDGALQGILADQWRAWEAATGVRVELRAMDWNEALAAMQRGEADVIDTTFRTLEREASWDFSKPYADIEVPIFVHRDVSGIAKPADLRGFRVAVKAGDACVEQLRALGVRDLVEYPSYEAVVSAAARRDILAFCADFPPALHFLYKAGAYDEWRIAFRLEGGSFHRAVAKGERELLALVESGFAAIPRSALDDIDRAWLGQPLPALEQARRLRVLALIATALLALALLLGVVAAVLRRRVARATEELMGKIAELEASENRNRAFIEALPDLFFTFDRDGRYLDYRTSSPELLALPPEAMIGRLISDMPFPPAVASLYLEAIAKALDSRKLVAIEYELAVLTGPRRFEGRLVPVGTDRVLFVARDITERSRQDARLRESLAEKEVLLREIHHRVKNNLQVVSSLVALQRDSIHDPRDLELMAETEHRIKAMARIHEILYRSGNFSSLDAGEYVSAIADDLAEASGARIEAVLEGGPFPIMLDDAVPLGLATNELVTNAVKYGRAPGSGVQSVQATLTNSGGCYTLLVTDSGPGLPDGFDPRRDGNMGFTLVRALASQLRAELAVVPGPGARVSLSFKPGTDERPSGNGPKTASEGPPASGVQQPQPQGPQGSAASREARPEA
ncbi:MAG: transporter substrate-binding domain-containing protein [Spirochaetales bacterium]|nr:transporter substrate-binding domain-containing protein [Spirochaetales bacterium]